MIEIKCNHCGSKLDYSNEHKLLEGSIILDFKIGEADRLADRLIECDDCQCEVFFDCNTFKVINVIDYDIYQYLREDKPTKTYAAMSYCVHSLKYFSKRGWQVSRCS